MQKTLLVISIFLISAFATRASDENYKMLWNAWKNIHNKFYSSAEETARFAIFMDTYDHIVKYNAESDNVKLGLNQFSDLTATEFKTLHTGCFNEDYRNAKEEKHLEIKDIEVPDTFDWRNHGAVTNVKNQGSCGSCWSFSATGALEGFYAIKRGSLLSFSEQQMVDCDSSDGACNGGFPSTALNYAAYAGVTLENNYPYIGKKGSCFYGGDGLRFNSGGFSVSKNRDEVKRALITNGPVTVGVQADQSIFQSYSSGVVTSGCGYNRDHAVLIVGYGSIGGIDAWAVKNSWGPGWGQGGYIYIATDPTQNYGEGVCGILGTAVVAG